MTPAPPARAVRRTGPAMAGTVATLTVALLAATAGPASAAPRTGALPGNAPLSPLATARPAGLPEAQRQFLARTPAAIRDQKLTWGPCPEEALPPGLPPVLECASLRAPRDWGAPTDGATVEIAISRVRREGPRPARTILTNPGGPGGAGLFVPLVLADRPALANSEVIGIDVRGTGASTNTTCGPEVQAEVGVLPDWRDRSPRALAATATAMRAIAKACSSSSPLAPFVNTEQTVADLDLVRALLGRERVDWVGYSGGTWLGAQYATYFPARVGRFVLDSAVDVAAPFQQVFAEDQPLGFQRRFAADFQPWAAKHHTRFRLGRTAQDVNGTYEALRGDLAQRPLDIPLVGRVDGVALDSMIAGAMYSKTSFEELARTLRLLRVISDLVPLGDRAGVQRLAQQVAPDVQQLLPSRPRIGAAPTARPAGSAPDAESATFYAVTCNDTAWSQGARFWNALGQRHGERYPLIGWSTTQQPCGYWKRPPLSLPKPDGRDLPPLLIVQSEHDPATPVEGARRSRAALPTSRLVLVRGEGDHALYASVGNPCVDAVVDTFLATGKAPARDVTCQGTGLPVPGERQAKGREQLRELITG
ncbi:alpha/beta hydrolase [Kineococcus sp. NUM-3379]